PVRTGDDLGRASGVCLGTSVVHDIGCRVHVPAPERRPEFRRRHSRSGAHETEARERNRGVLTTSTMAITGGYRPIPIVTEDRVDALEEFSSEAELATERSELGAASAAAVSPLRRGADEE